MLKEERQELILGLLRSNGKVLATELSDHLAVSEDTIRRDLRDLAEAKLIQRVHGGALLRTASADNYFIRQKQAVEAKAEIAQAALGLIRSGQLIVMDGGTSTTQLARALPYDLSVTIITNSPQVAIALSEHPKVEVCLVGGKYYKKGQVTVGVEAVRAFGTFRADLCFLGVCSLHSEFGITTVELEEVYTKQAMISCAAEVVALAAAAKLETAAPYLVSPLKALSYIVTEKQVSDEIIKTYQSLGIVIVKA